MHKDSNLKKQAKVSHLAAISQSDFTLFSKVCFLSFREIVISYLT